MELASRGTASAGAVALGVRKSGWLHVMGEAFFQICVRTSFLRRAVPDLVNIVVRCLDERLP